MEKQAKVFVCKSIGGDSGQSLYTNSQKAKSKRLRQDSEACSQKSFYNILVFGVLKPKKGGRFIETPL